jgi:hypothetical protein
VRDRVLFGIAVLLAVVAVALAVAGCGSDDSATGVGDGLSETCLKAASTLADARDKGLDDTDAYRTLQGSYERLCT